jgi:drug/metabolite transporter (DMT)-like permease
MGKLVWALPLLVAGVSIFSAAATALSLMENVSGSMKAAWRLQVASYVMIILQAYDWVTQRDACYRMWSQEWRLIVISGIQYGLFFTLFAISLQLTSMAHCLVLSSCCPIAFICYEASNGKPVYKWEAFGVALSLFGALLVVLDINSGDSQATWYGDLLALLAMVACSSYMINAQIILKEREAPLFAYFAPVNVIASLTAYLFACSLGEDDMFFEWTSPENLIPVLFVSLGPGIVVELLLNYLAIQISILLISVFLNLEPFIGSFLGWLFGFQASPSILLWLGGFISIAGNTVVTLYGGDAKEAKKLSSDSKEDFELTKPFL